MKGRPVVSAAVLVALLVTAVLAGLLTGGAPGIGVAEAWNALTGGADPLGLEHALVFEVRMPRILLLVLAGAALSVSGVALQACLQNPLADPGLLGISGGASLGAVAAYASGAAITWPPSVPLAAFAGAFIAIALVFLMAHASGRPTTGVLLLTGVAVGSLASALVSVLLTSVGDHRVHEMVAWLLGSAEGRTWQHVRLGVIPILVGLAGLLALQRAIDALALGEEQALGLGVDLSRARGVLLALVALTAGSAVSVVGPVGFVGLMVPHMMRGPFGHAARTLAPAAALGGATLLVLSDIVSRALSRVVDVPVGVITAFLGVPFFLVLLHRVRREG